MSGRIPDFSDLHVFAIADDGTEVELHNVDHIKFDAVACCEPIRATLTFINVEIDVEAQVGEDGPVDTSEAGRALADVHDAVLLSDSPLCEITAADVQRVRDMNHVERASRVAAAKEERRRIMTGDPR